MNKTTVQTKKNRLLSAAESLQLTGAKWHSKDKRRGGRAFLPPKPLLRVSNHTHTDTRTVTCIYTGMNKQNIAAAGLMKCVNFSAVSRKRAKTHRDEPLLLGCSTGLRKI